MGERTPNNPHSLLEIRVTHPTGSMFPNSERSIDPLQTIELDKQRSTPCHENETEKESANVETRGDLDTVIQSSFDLGISLIGCGCRIFGCGRFNFRDIMSSVFLWGDRNNFIGDFRLLQKGRRSLELSVDRYLFSFPILGKFQLELLGIMS